MWCSPDDARKHKRAGKCDGKEKERDRANGERRKKGRGDEATRYLFSLTKYFSLRATLNLSRVLAELYLCEIQPANGDVHGRDISKRDSRNYDYG